MVELLFHGVPPLIIGCLAGYLYGLSLIKQGKALSFSFAAPLIRFACIIALSLLLLRWGIFPFILFFGSFMITMWIVVLTQNR
jgi:hypothetical protein